MPKYQNYIAERQASQCKGLTGGHHNGLQNGGSNEIEVDEVDEDGSDSDWVEPQTEKHQHHISAPNEAVEAAAPSCLLRIKLCLPHNHLFV
jgi:hypothetical protein